MSWTQLNPQDSAKFIETVADKNEAAIFEPALCEVHTRPLSFYDGYALTRIVNKAMLPFIQLDYLSDGENHYYLDGSEAAFHNLNAQHAISLDETNALDYLNLYISYVYERGNSFEFFQTPQEGFETRLLGSQDDTYQATAPLLYQGRTVQSQIDVQQNGAIHVHKPIDVSFLSAPKPGDETNYRHPHETKIIEDAKALLSTSDTAMELLKDTPEIRVFSSPNYHGFITNSAVIYLMMPAAEQTAKYLQALILAGFLRGAQHTKKGYIIPPLSDNEELFIVAHMGRNLDMLLTMCKIVEEFENKQITEGAYALGRLEFTPVYEAYKAGQSEDQLMEVYLDTLEELGRIER